MTRRSAQSPFVRTRFESDDQLVTKTNSSIEGKVEMARPKGDLNLFPSDS